MNKKAKVSTTKKKRSVEPAYNKTMALINYMNAQADETDAYKFIAIRGELEKVGYRLVLSTTDPMEARTHYNMLKRYSITAKIIPFTNMSDVRVFTLFEKF